MVKIKSLIAGAAVWLWPAVVLAQASSSGNIGLGVVDLNTAGNFKTSLLTVVNLFLYFAGFVALLYLIWGGFQYVTSAGDDEKAGKGRASVTNAIIGIAIIVIALLIVRYVSNTFRFDTI